MGASNGHAPRLDFRLLGPLEVLADGVALDLGPRMQRAVLAVLALEAGRIVPVGRIVHGLWADDAPASATGTLQAYISQLRRILEPARAPRTPPSVVLTRAPGYLLAVEPNQVDALSFAAAVDAGRAQLACGEVQAAARRLEAALAMWRGEPLREFATEEFATTASVRLVEVHAAAVEELVEAWLALGLVAQAGARARELLGAHPFRERSWRQLMLALYREGRQADALAAYREARRVLDEELGIEPGPELRALQEAILRQDPRLRAVAEQSPAPQPPPTQRPAEPAEPAAAAPVSDLVGRRDLLRRATARLASVAQGQGGLLLVVGEAGVGKTSFVEAVADLARLGGMGVAWSRCVECSASAPYWPWVQLMRTLGADPGLLEVLRGRGVSQWNAEELDAAQFHLHESIVDVLRTTANHLLVIEDIHVADGPSLRALSYVGTQLAELPLLVVATMRPETPGDELDARLGGLANEKGFERVPVPAFTTDEIFDFLRSKLDAVPDASVVRALADRTGGNPFYLTEVVRLLGEQNPTGWGSVQAVAEAGVPEGVRGVIRRRVARLPETTQELLRTAATIGRDVDLSLLENAADVDNETALGLLEPAVLAGLLVEAPASWDYRFSHALVRDAVYADLSRLQRARLHWRVAEALEGMSGGDDCDELNRLTHHFVLGARIGGSDKAVRYATKTARLAGAQLAFHETVRLLDIALGVLDPRGPDAGPTRCRLLVELGRAMRVVGDKAGAQRVLEEAIQLGNRLGDDAAVIEAVSVFGGVAKWLWRDYHTVDERMVGVLETQLARLGPDQRRERAVLLGTLGVELLYSPRQVEGAAFAGEAVSIARELGDDELRARTLNNFVFSSWWPENEAARRAAIDEMLALDPPRTVELVGLMHRMMSYTTAGELDAYERDLARAQHLIADHPTAEHVAQVAACASGGQIQRGRWDEAERLADEAFDQLAQTNLWGAHWIRMIVLYASRRFQGRGAELLDEIVALAQDHDLLRPTAVLAACDAGQDDLARALIDRWGTPWHRDWSWDVVGFQWALVSARLGTPDPRMLYEAIAPYKGWFAIGGSSCAIWGCLEFALAELADRLGDVDGAREHATAALAAHRRIDAAHLVAASQTQLARLHTRSARRERLGGG